MSNRTATIARRFVAFAALNSFAVALLLAAFYVSSLNTFTRDPGAHTLSTPAPTQTSLLEKGRGCWTGQAPAHTIPGHVVAMVPGGHTVYGGRKLTAQALDQTFGGHDHQLSVIAFCR